jgi:hypothetical protein
MNFVAELMRYIVYKGIDVDVFQVLEFRESGVPVDTSRHCDGIVWDVIVTMEEHDAVLVMHAVSR